jgi:hypothetical protein
MWTTSAAHAAYLPMNGPLFSAASWDDTVSDPLRLQGDVQWMHERIILWDTDNNSSILNAQAATLTHNATVNFAQNQQYTMNVGFFSLYGGQDENTWLNTTGASVTQGLQLYTAKNSSIISSLSYGLQIGSPSLDIEPSLVLGGYDRSRCLTEPITSTNSTFRLHGISLASQSYPFTSLMTNGSSSQNVSVKLDAPLQVLANPGVPYLYLPADTCNAIAQHIPVTYNDNFGLYMWNTTDPKYKNITQTLTYLTLALSGTDNTQQDINIPFALLDLTLEYPLTTTETHYFPCSPFSPAASNQPYHLGRAFLQAALLAQNWETNTTWLSQAPGPDATNPSTPVTIAGSHVSIAAMPNPPPWIGTWNKTLKADYPLSQNAAAGSIGSLAGGTIAGIVIGAVAAVVIIAAVILVIVRRRRRSKAGYGDVALNSYAESENSRPLSSSEGDGKDGATEAFSTPIHEADDTEKGLKLEELPSHPQKVHLVEVDGTGIAELPGSEAHSR